MQICCRKGSIRHASLRSVVWPNCREASRLLLDDDWMFSISRSPPPVAQHVSRAAGYGTEAAAGIGDGSPGIEAGEGEEQAALMQFAAPQQQQEQHPATSPQGPTPPMPLLAGDWMYDIVRPHQGEVADQLGSVAGTAARAGCAQFAPMQQNQSIGQQQQQVQQPQPQHSRPGSAATIDEV